jgi:hypothetical protein
MRSGWTAATVQDAGWCKESPPSSPAHGCPLGGYVAASWTETHARGGAPVETLQCNVSTATGDRRGATGGQRPAGGSPHEHEGCGRARRGEAFPRALPIQAGLERSVLVGMWGRMPGMPRPYDGTPPSVHRPSSIVIIRSFPHSLLCPSAHSPSSGTQALTPRLGSGDPRERWRCGRAGQPRPSRTQVGAEGKRPLLPGARRAPLPGTPQRPGRKRTPVGRPRRDVAVQRLYRDR